MNPALLAAAFALGLLSGPVVDKPWALARWGPIVATLTEAPRVDASPTRGRVVLRVDLPSVLHAQIDEVDDEWLRVRLRPLSLAGQRFPTKIGDLAGLRVVEAGEGVVDVLLRPRYPLHYTIRQRPDGIVLLIGRRSAALDGARWQPLAIGDDDTADAGPPPMTSQAELAKLHAAAASLGQGHLGDAFVALDALTLASSAPTIRLDARRMQAEALLAGGATIVAVMPLADALAEAHDRPTFRQLVAALEAIRQQHPAALRLAAPTLLALPPTPGADAGWLDFEQGRLLLQRGETEEAAEHLWRARSAPGAAPRARLLVALAATLAGDVDAATRHLVTLLSDEATPDAIDAQARLWLARLRYGNGLLDEAASSYRSIETPALQPAVERELAWLDLRRAASPAALASLVPFPLDRDHVDHALLVGILYLRQCHPQRAAAVATVLIDRLTDQSPLLTEARRQLAQLGPDWDAARPTLEARLNDAAVELSRGVADRDRRQTADALRLRIEADDLLAAEIEARGAEAPPPEPPGFGAQDGQWVDAARGRWVDRCGVGDDGTDLP